MKKSLLWFGVFFVLFLFYIFRPWGQENATLTLIFGSASLASITYAIVLMLQEDKEEDEREEKQRRKNFSNRSW